MKYRLGLAAEPLVSRIDERLLGVGMIRSEYLCRVREEYIPLDTCRAAIREYVENVCSIYAPHDVWYRTTELVVPEVNVLQGADHLIEEKHYAFGLRGVRRAVRYPETFRLEIANLAEIAERHPNLGILLPYVGDADELRFCLNIIRSLGFKGKCGAMAEIPSAVLLLDQFADCGITNITVGINDLTALTLGTFRGSEVHNPMHPAVLKQIESAVGIAQGYGIPLSVGGYVSKTLGEFCEQVGVDYLIVHYTELPAVLGVAPDDLPHLAMLQEIKKLTKSRIAAQERNDWERRIGPLHQT